VTERPRERGHETDGSFQPTNLRISTRNPGFKKIGVKPGRGPNPGASSERSGPLLFVINGAQDPATLRVDQMRLSARKARHLNMGQFIVFGIISGPSLDVVAGVGAAAEEGRHARRP
jgi:hypothetical protein